MNDNNGTRTGRISWAGRAALVLAGAAAGAAGLWLWQTGGAAVTLWPTLGVLTLAAPIGLVWRTRASADRRLFAAWDKYAEQELARGPVRRPRRR